MDNRKAYKKYLKYGDIHRIAIAAGVTSKTVNRYLGGENNNGFVAEALKHCVLRNKRELQQSINQEFDIKR